MVETSRRTRDVPAPERSHTSRSGVPLQPVYRDDDLSGFDPEADLGAPGAYPFTRGVYPSMYRGRIWTMRQFAGYGTPRDVFNPRQLQFGAKLRF